MQEIPLRQTFNTSSWLSRSVSPSRPRVRASQESYAVLRCTGGSKGRPGGDCAAACSWLVRFFFGL